MAMSNEEINTKCLLLDIEIEQLGVETNLPWTVWRRKSNGNIRNAWSMLCPVGKTSTNYASFATKEDALIEYTTHRELYEWD